MKINLAVWTAVNGYAWQPGSVYSPEELAKYKDEIGRLDANGLPFGGLFLKDGKAVFWRTQIASYMDSYGRDAVYCVVGAVPEDMAVKVDFHAVFASSEVSKPQKPFPTSLELPERTGEFKSPLGNAAFAERRVDGVETFAELGGWCEEAKGGRLDVRIMGSLDVPLFIVAYKPRTMPSSPPPPLRPVGVGAHREIPSRPGSTEWADIASASSPVSMADSVAPRMNRADARPKAAVVQSERRRSSDIWTSEPSSANWGRTTPDVDGIRAKTSDDSLWTCFACLACGFVLGVIATAAVCFWSFNLKASRCSPTSASTDVAVQASGSPENTSHGAKDADEVKKAPTSEDVHTSSQDEEASAMGNKGEPAAPSVPKEARNKDNEKS